MAVEMLNIPALLYKIRSCNISMDISKESIMEKVSHSSVFLVLNNETADISKTEEISFCLKCIDPDKNVLREDIVGFISISDLNKERIALYIINRLEISVINTKVFIDQGYASASVKTSMVLNVPEVNCGRIKNTIVWCVVVWKQGDFTYS